MPDLLQDELRAIRNKDKWGLPREWRFWADPAFWIVAPLLSVKYLSGAVRLSSNFWQGLDISILWLLIGVALLCDAVTGWVVYDSYRWDIPQRYLYLALLLTVWIIGLPYCLLERPQWMMELKRRRHLPY